MNLDTKLTCPKCGCESHMAAFSPSEEIRELARLAAKFGRNWAWVEAYLDSFRSSPDKPLKCSRLKILIHEILDFIEKGGVKYDGQFHGVRSDAIFGACRVVALANKTGFRNHNYLKKVAIDLNLKMIQKEEGEQKNRAQEALKRDPRGPEKIKQICENLDSGFRRNDGSY